MVIEPMIVTDKIGLFIAFKIFLASDVVSLKYKFFIF